MTIHVKHTSVAPMPVPAARMQLCPLPIQVPEVVVGRVAMAGWAALLVSELLEHRTAPQLLMDRPVAAAWVTWGVAAASCLPGAWRVRRRCGGTFSAAAETANGRLAMLAFALVAVTEALRGRPTFG